MRTKRKFRESQLQQACVLWYRLQYSELRKLLFSVPNGSVLRGSEKERAIQWNRLEAEGAVPGVSDLILAIPTPNSGLLFIEMKSDEGSQSKEQIAFEKAVKSQNYPYVVIDNLDDFMKVVNNRMHEAGLPVKGWKKTNLK